MTPMEMLLTRASSERLTEPAPQGDVLRDILSAALRAPDHGKLRPWRYVVVQGEHRQTLAELVVKGMLERDPDVPAFKLEKRRVRFSTTPMTIALGMALRHDHKIPVIEQEMAVAAGAMNVLNALHATGFGGLWVTGDMAEDPAVATALGFNEPHRLAGFIFVGTPDGQATSPKRPDIDGYWSVWDGRPRIFLADQETV